MNQLLHLPIGPAALAGMIVAYIAAATRLAGPWAPLWSELIRRKPVLQVVPALIALLPQVADLFVDVNTWPDFWVSVSAAIALALPGFLSKHDTPPTSLAGAGGASGSSSGREGNPNAVTIQKLDIVIPSNVDPSRIAREVKTQIDSLRRTRAGVAMLAAFCFAALVACSSDRGKDAQYAIQGARGACVLWNKAKASLPEPSPEAEAVCPLLLDPHKACRYEGAGGAP